MRVLVTGATGNVGGHVARQLAGGDLDVVALVRSGSSSRLPPGIRVVEGDLTSVEDVRRALDGVDRAFLNMADDDGAVFAAEAGRSGVAGVVLLSSFATAVTLPNGADNVVTARHRAGERALSDAGVPSAFLRCAGFASNVLIWAGDAGMGLLRAPYPDVALPIVHPADIAACTVAALTGSAAITGTFSVTGPAKLSVRDQARVLTEVLGRPFEVERIDEDEAARVAFPPGTPPLVVSSVLGTMSPAAAALEVSAGVSSLTGRPALTFADWVSENREAFA